MWICKKKMTIRNQRLKNIWKCSKDIVWLISLKRLNYQGCKSNKKCVFLLSCTIMIMIKNKKGFSESLLFLIGANPIILEFIMKYRKSVFHYEFRAHSKRMEKHPEGLVMFWQASASGCLKVEIWSPFVDCSQSSDLIWKQ